MRCSPFLFVLWQIYCFGNINFGIKSNSFYRFFISQTFYIDFKGGILHMQVIATFFAKAFDFCNIVSGQCSNGAVGTNPCLTAAVNKQHITRFV